ncbi:hypothetical protein HUT16_17375 [Kitasatospora sp. NA04385]|uniref:hypothetical protein n=1 Tax=Kitasatospora sp. NA04385 TaxID=2742135 RepID=UPI001591904F|nr:hypothetical protein [Kitasatospora sp. NA04385]QKW20604.1 hypothetical protein HUT16_17375 [Kitasatospora sp. NA04385]
MLTGPDLATTPDEQVGTLLQFGQDLAARLPGTWSADSIDISTGAARSDLHDQLWDQAVADWILWALAYQRAGIVTDGGLRTLLVLPRPHPYTGQYAVAPLLPEALGTAYDFEDLTPQGITVGSDPARAAFAVRTRLLPRYSGALRAVLAREIGTSPPSGAETADGTAAGESGSEPEDAPAYVSDGRRWHSDPRDALVLRQAVRSLLLAAEVRFDEELTGATDVLAGGGEYICDREGLDADLAPVIEAAALTAVLDAAGLRVHSLLDPALPDRVEQLESWPQQRQRQAFQLAARPLAPQAAGRHAAARVRSATHPAPVIRPATAAAPAPAPPAAHLPARPTL